MGTLCAHCAPGKGCGVYDSRPHACRTFECVWLMDPEMPHRFRPDQTRVVLDQDPGGTRLIARCDPANPLAWRRNPIYGALKGHAADTWGRGKIVMAVAGRHVWVITPRGDIDLGQVDPRSDLRITEGARGDVQVEVVGPEPDAGQARGCSGRATTTPD